MDSKIYEEDKSQRRRVIIVASAIAVIVLGIAIWAIVAIVSGSQTKVSTTNQVAVDDAKSSETATVKETVNETTAPATEGVSVTTESQTEKKAEQNTTSAQKTTTVNNTVTTNQAVPDTGPEELLPVALVAGSAIAFIASRRMAKAEVVA